MSPEALPILVLGTLTVDTVETPAGRGEGVPGGSALYFAAAAGLLAPVRVLGAAGEDFPEEALALLRERRAEMEGVVRLPGSSMSWHARYAPDLSRRETVHADRGVLERWEPEVPPGWRETPVVFLGSTDPRLQDTVLDRVSAPALVAADSMAHWIRRRRAGLEAVLARTDLFFASGEECRALGGARDAGEAAAAIRRSGPRWVVEKRGRRGAVLHGPGDPVAVPAFPTPNVVDPTGAGDAFAGGAVGWLAREAAGAAHGAPARLGDALPGPTLERALAAGAAAASFAVEGFSVEGLAAATAADLRRRTRAL